MNFDALTYINVYISPQMLIRGFKAMLPITTGVIPFGLVMGTVASNAQVEGLQLAGMNLIVFAGASQLAAIDLMTKNTPSLIVIATGLIINLRFMLYSAAFSPVVKDESFLTKLFCSYSITDQTYAGWMANQKILKTNKDTLHFYLGASICMILAWQSAVAMGFVFGNFAPASLALEFAVPLSFVALVLPTIKNRNYIYVGLLSAILSVLLVNLPFRTGLLCSSLTAIAFGAFLTRKKRPQ